MIDPSIIDAKIAAEQNSYQQRRDSLFAALESVGFSRKYTGHDPRPELVFALEAMVESRARIAMLDIIRSPDFYSALMRSAGEIPT